MRGNLVIELINAHVNNNNQLFIETVDKIVNIEEKKGNNSLANKIKNISKKKNNNSKNNNYEIDLSKSNVYSASDNSQSYLLPKDKDSKLSLYEIIESKVSLNEVILPVNQMELILDIIKEFKLKEKLFENNLLPSNKLLLYGPPGCGKTMTATAIANELNLPLVYVRLDSLVSSYLGQTGTNLRKIFDSIQNKEVVLFFDEFDAIAKKRDDKQELGELKRVVTTLLQNLDMINTHVFFIAATNHEQLLDPAIWRRFNNVINIDFPNLELRKEFLNFLFKKYNLEDIDIDKTGKLFKNINPSQIEEIIRQTIKKNLINNRKITTINDIIRTYAQHITKNSINNDGDIKWEVIKHLNEKGITLKLLESITSIPKSTISYNLKKLEKGD